MHQLLLYHITVRSFLVKRNVLQHVNIAFVFDLTKEEKIYDS